MLFINDDSVQCKLILFVGLYVCLIFWFFHPYAYFKTFIAVINNSRFHWWGYIEANLVRQQRYGVQLPRWPSRPLKMLRIMSRRHVPVKNTYILHTYDHCNSRINIIIVIIMAIKMIEKKLKWVGGKDSLSGTAVEIRHFQERARDWTKKMLYSKTGNSDVCSSCGTLSSRFIGAQWTWTGDEKKTEEIHHRLRRAADRLTVDRLKSKSLDHTFLIYHAPNLFTRKRFLLLLFPRTDVRRNHGHKIVLAHA